MDLDLDPERYRLRFTGPAIIAARESRLVRREATVSFIFSLALVVLVFAAAFRRWGAVIWLSLPLAGGVAVTLSGGDMILKLLKWRGLVESSGLSVLAASAAAVLVGLGIDFGIHLYTRALDRRAEGASAEEAVRAAAPEYLARKPP